MSLEPFDAKALHRLLTKTFGGSVISQTGSHLTIRMPNGVQVPCPDPHGGSGLVPTVLARRIARLLNRDLPWLELQLGYDRRAGTAPTKGKRSGRPVSLAEAQATAEATARISLKLVDHLRKRPSGPHADELRRRIGQELPPVSVTIGRLVDLAESS